jgi:hypothetical protein
MDGPYRFRREDDGRIVECDFATMMAGRNGFITLPDGVEARRCWNMDAPKEWKAPATGQKMGPQCRFVSDSLGFPITQLADFEADRKASGIRGIEFKVDPTEPGFIQVHARSRSERDRYARHRGMVDQSKRGSVFLTQEQLDRAAELVSRGLTTETAA